MATLVGTLTDTDTHKLWHVKLDKPRIARKMSADGSRGGYVQVEYVLIGVSDIEKEDKLGKFSYRETCILGTDETGKSEPIYMYLVQGCLTLDEALWTIGDMQ